MPSQSSRAQKAKKDTDKSTSPKVPRVKVTGGKPVQQSNDGVTHPIQRSGDALSLQGSIGVQSKTHRQAMPADEYLPVPSKLEKRFYEVMVVLWAFDRIRGSRIQRFPANEDPTSQELRRSFTDSLAYACDSRKGGMTTSAALLQQLPQGVVVWLAGNRGVKQNTVTDLTKLLSEALRNIRSHKPFDREVTLVRLVHMNEPRLKSYIKLACGNMDRCIKTLQGSSADGFGIDVTSTLQWLKQLKHVLGDDSPILEIVKDCFQARKTAIFQTLTVFAKDGQDKCFTSLRHHIGRLGRHVQCTNTIYDALERFPGLLENFTIKPLPKPRATPFPLLLSAQRFQGIPGRMFKADQREEAVKCQEKLLDISRCFEGGLPKFLDKLLPKETVVHAELQLLDHARHEDIEFLDHDKYIGCSKPACYACYHYILAMAPEYSAPPSHYKLYLTWRVPDVLKHRGEAAAKIRDNVMNKMNEVFRAHLIREIDGRGKRPNQPDSTTGVTTLPYCAPARPTPLQEDQGSSAGIEEELQPSSLPEDRVTSSDNEEHYRPAPLREDGPPTPIHHHELDDDASFHSCSGNASEMDNIANFPITADPQSNLRHISLTSGLDIVLENSELPANHRTTVSLIESSHVPPSSNAALLEARHFVEIDSDDDSEEGGVYL